LLTPRQTSRGTWGNLNCLILASSTRFRAFGLDFADVLFSSWIENRFHMLRQELNPDSLAGAESSLSPPKIDKCSRSICNFAWSTMVLIFCMEPTKVNGNCQVRAMSRLLSIAMENASKPELIQSAYCDEYGERGLYRWVDLIRARI